MSLTIQLDGNESARVSDQRVETQPPDHVKFVAEGVLTVSEGLMGDFEGTALKPTEVILSVDGSETVAVDLTADPSLRLEEVDVGVETPDADDISQGVNSLDPTTDRGDETPDVSLGAIAFTVEGAILDVPDETFESLSDGEITPKSITFALDEVARGDGGSNDDVVLEVTLLGYGVVIYRDGVIEIGTTGGGIDIGLP